MSRSSVARIVTTALLLIAIPVPTAARTSEPVGASFSPVEPCRLLDTRTDRSGASSEAGGSTRWRVQVTGRCGAPAEVAAATLTVTATRARGDGFVSVGAAGRANGDWSNLNVRAGRTIANTIVTAVSDDGAIDVLASTAVDIVVDLDGLFVEVDGPVAAGRLVAVHPRRVADTRDPEQYPIHGVTALGAGALHIDLDGMVPDDAIAVAVQITATQGRPGYLAAHASGAPPPGTSVLNLDRADPTRATTVFSAVSGHGLTVLRSAPAHLVVDLWGYFTGPSAAPSTAGLLVPEAPVRVWDSRRDHDPLHAGGHLTRQVAPAEAAVAVLNVTAVGSTDVGYLSIGSTGGARPDTSNLNHRWTEPIAAMTLARNTTAGVTIWSPTSGTHVVVDRLGWFTGGALAADALPDRNPMPDHGGRVLLVTDSSFAGIRWSGASGLLTGASFDARLESCRRLSGVSCRGREGYAPPTAVDEVRSVQPGSVDVLVVGTGYNDHSSQFLSGFAQVMEAARLAGIDRVVWLTYREPVTYRSPSELSNALTFAANNRTLRALAASGGWPELQLLDWNAHSAGMDDWVTSDGVHITPEGARAAAAFLSRALAHYDRRPCGAAGGVTEPGGWCADPTGRR